MSQLSLLYRPRSTDSLSAVVAWAIAHFEQIGTKPRLRVSFSGGRTSAYMAKLVKDSLSQYFEIIFVFANTGWEHADTLRFVNDVDVQFGLGLTWVEAVVFTDERKSCGHKVVSYETASRNGEPFRAVVAKYGIPNRTWQLCNRELKKNAMESFSRSIGWESASYFTAIGIRADEPRRVKETADVQGILYPLVTFWPVDKQDVLSFFDGLSWDLQIEEFEGNCLGCYKKSDRKLNAVWRKSPEVFDFPVTLDQLYRNVGPNKPAGPRKMYRGYRSPQELVAEFSASASDPAPTFSNEESNSCSESCEPFDMEAA